jgi:hypothetical protein
VPAVPAVPAVSVRVCGIEGRTVAPEDDVLKSRRALIES